MLTQRLFGLLRKTGTAEVPARVVNHASVAASSGKVNFEDINLQGAGTWTRYCQSKVSNLYFTNELAKRLEEEKIDNVIATAAHPGYSSTNLQANASSFPGWRTANNWLAQSPKDGTLPLVQASVGKANNGEYIGPQGWTGMSGPPGTVKQPSQALNADIMKKFWDESEKWCKITFPMGEPAELQHGDPAAEAVKETKEKDDAPELGVTEEVEKKNDMPLWILGLGGVGIVTGLLLYGYKIIKAIGFELTKLSPSRGFSIELGAALVVLTGSRLEIPLSTTHCQVGATVGVGLTEGCSNVNWKLFGKVVAGWIFTIVVAAFLTAGVFSYAAYSPQANF